jgi:hypothetical protein
MTSAYLKSLQEGIAAPLLCNGCSIPLLESIRNLLLFLKPKFDLLQLLQDGCGSNYSLK